MHCHEKEGESEVDKCHTPYTRYSCLPKRSLQGKKFKYIHRMFELEKIFPKFHTKMQGKFHLYFFTSVTLPSRWYYFSFCLSP